MPYTPFHFGPGLLFKSVIPTRFSFLAFATTQVVIDLDSLYYLTLGERPVHRSLHTLGAAMIAGVGTGLAVCGLGAVVRRPLRHWDHRLSITTPRREVTSELTVDGSLIGGLVGGFTHVLLDSLMHLDIRPLWALTDRNPLTDLIGPTALERGCVAAGVLALVVLAARPSRWRGPA